MKRNCLIDILRFLLSLFIVAIHVELYKDYDITYSIFTHIRELSIPLFSIISGYYITESLKQRGKNYVWKYIIHVIVVYFLWSTIYYATCCTRMYLLAEGRLYLNVRMWLLDRFTLEHFWYFGTLLLGILVIVFLEQAKKRIREKVINISFSIIMVVFALLFALTAGYSFLLPNNPINALFTTNSITHLIRRMVLYSFPFIGAGYLINSYKEKILSRKWGILTIFGMIIYIVECFAVEILNSSSKTVAPYIFTICCFSLLLTIKTDRISEKMAGFCRYISGFIYCFHTIPLYWCRFSDIKIITGKDYKDYIFVLLVSIVLGTLLYVILGKRIMKKIVA